MTSALLPVSRCHGSLLPFGFTFPPTSLHLSLTSSRIPKNLSLDFFGLTEACGFTMWSRSFRHVRLILRPCLQIATIGPNTFRTNWLGQDWIAVCSFRVDHRHRLRTSSRRASFRLFKSDCGHLAPHSTNEGTSCF